MTPTPISTLIKQSGQFVPVAPSDVMRWAIVQVNNLLGGIAGQTNPTLQQIETAAGQVEQIQNPKQLNAIVAFCDSGVEWCWNHIKFA